MNNRKSYSSFGDCESNDIPLLNETDYSLLSETQITTTEKKSLSSPIKYFISIILGICFGIGLNYLKVSDNIITLCTLPGSLFLRALQCAVIPMMFFNIVCSIYDVFGSGSAGNMGKRAIWLYTLTTIIATIEGIIMANVFSSLLESDNGYSDDDDGVKVSLVCPEDEGMMTVMTDGTILCIPHEDLDSYNVTTKYQNFFLRDKDEMLINGVIIKQSLVDQVVGTAYSIIPNNFVQAFSAPNIISVIVIGTALGAALIKLEKSPRVSGPCKLILTSCKEFCDITNEIISWVIEIAPYCIGFLVAASLASAGNVVDLLRTVGVYVISVILGILLHIFITLPLLYYYYTDGLNPYSWLILMKQPLIVAFSTASSAATLPVSIKTVIETGFVEEMTANTLLPLGATMNMDGTAIGFPCAINFLAHSAKLESKLDIATWVNVGLASSLGSAGAAPVPNAGIVMLITVWETALPGYTIPDAIAYVQGIEFLLDRFRTATNVCSDLFIVRMIQVMVEKERKQQM